MIKAKVIGAGGYGGVGITELLMKHPEAGIACLVDKTDVGRRMSDLYPHLDGFCDMEIVDPEDARAQEAADVVFFATPDGVAMQAAGAELDKGAKVIDYSGDFRFNNLEDYAEYARRLGRDPEHKSPDLLTESVYGLPELNRERITPDTRLVGNVGCFAISCLLGLAPAVREKLVDIDSIICDSKTGVSGAGKKPGPAFHYPSRYDNMNAYRLTGHQHVMEIEKNLTILSGDEVRVTFTAQVVPACRGILSCLYGSLRDGIGIEAVLDAYRSFHADHPFVRMYDRNSGVGTHHVRGSNYCNLIVDVDERTNRLRIISHIDNLVKGQAGNALQNMNLLFGFSETTGLDHFGQHP